MACRTENQPTDGRFCPVRKARKTGLIWRIVVGSFAAAEGFPAAARLSAPPRGEGSACAVSWLPLKEKAFCCPAHTKSLKNRRAGCTIPLLYKAALGCLTADNFAASYRGPAQGGKGRAAAGFCAPPRRKRRNQPWKNGPAIF